MVVDHASEEIVPFVMENTDFAVLPTIEFRRRPFRYS
jgi:hypothetical protein